MKTTPTIRRIDRDKTCRVTGTRLLRAAKLKKAMRAPKRYKAHICYSGLVCATPHTLVFLNLLPKGLCKELCPQPTNDFLRIASFVSEVGDRGIRSNPKFHKSHPLEVASAACALIHGESLLVNSCSRRTGGCRLAAQKRRFAALRQRISRSTFGGFRL
jgi:hypothetical protein